MDKLSRTAMDFALSNGAALAAIATVETLAGGREIAFWQGASIHSTPFKANF